MGKQGKRGGEKRGEMAAARGHHIVWEKHLSAAEISERRDGIENWAFTSRLRSDERSDPAGGLPAIYLMRDCGRLPSVKDVKKILSYTDQQGSPDHVS